MKTPLTDAETALATNVADNVEVVPAQFARQLERENAEMRGKLERFIEVVERDGGSVYSFWVSDNIRAILNEGSK